MKAGAYDSMAVINLIEFVIPLFFVLAIVYGALEFGSPIKNKSANILISVIIAFVAATSAEVVQLVIDVLPYAAIFFIIVFFLGFIKKSFKDHEKDYTLIVIIAGLVLIFMASQGMDILNAFLPYSFPITTENFLLIIGIVIIIAIFYATYKNWK